MLKSVEDSFLYFIPKSKEVVSKSPVDFGLDRFSSYESFTPTLSPTALKMASSLWLVYFTFTTYDSFEESAEICYEIIDLYKSAKQARVVAEKIYDRYQVWTSDDQPVDSEICYANGQQVKHLVCDSWGYRFRGSAACQINITKTPQTMIFGDIE